MPESNRTLAHYLAFLEMFEAQELAFELIANDLDLNSEPSSPSSSEPSPSSSSKLSSSSVSSVSENDDPNDPNHWSSGFGSEEIAE